MPGLDPVARLPEHLLANARLLPDREAILPLLPKRKVIAEVGVALGYFSDHFIRVCEPEHFIAVDSFDLHNVPALWGRPTKELFSGGTHGEFFRNRFADLIAQGKMQVLEDDSVAALAMLADASLDIVYLDADHSYDAVRRELAMVRRKIKDDGLIMLNDYIMSDAGLSNAVYGVIHATNEFMITENWEMIYFAFHSQMYCDVVLRKASTPPAPMLDGRPADPHGLALLRRNAELEARNAALERELEIVRASTSWRITGPLRAIRQALTPRQARSMRQE
ncbi:MAG TPA: class I SAM-dependent methyltransferase [Acetobacteraceae bacterium]|jgi:hypothetical protein|nr:class I SAM-dependent methyltransferase [Acetobacteraceae bacterium]